MDFLIIFEPEFHFRYSGFRGDFVYSGLLCHVSQKATGGSMFEDHIDVDYRLIPAALLIFCAFLLLAGIALVCSTRIGVIPSLTVCSLLFLLG